MPGWDVSLVTDLSELFKGATAFNADIGGWDVSKVTEMSWMFDSATVFNAPIGDWDVSHTTAKTDMFIGAAAFNQPIGDWDVSKVTDMDGIFDGACGSIAQRLQQVDFLACLRSACALGQFSHGNLVADGLHLGRDGRHVSNSVCGCLLLDLVEDVGKIGRAHV